MKKRIFSIFVFISLIFAVSQLSAGSKSESFNKSKRDAEAAFAELDGKTPEPAAKTKEKPVQDAKNQVKPASAEDDLLSFAVLKGRGIGKDEKSAKFSALSELSSSIVVAVSSQLQISQEEKDGKYSQSLKEDIKTRSDTFLKGVRFTKPEKTGNGIEITAFMTEKDVINTISYLLKTMPFDIETLSPEKFDDVLTAIYLSYSLLYAVSDAQVKERQKYINILNNLKAEIENLATSGSIYFSAKGGISGKVEISGKEYALNKKIHLQPGNYNFTVKSDGYKTLGGKFFISKGDKKFVELILVPEKMGKKEVYLRVESPVRMIDDIEKTLLDFGIVPTQNKNLPHSLVVVLKGTTTKVDNYERYTLEVDVHTFKNGQKFKITHYEHKPFFVTPQNRNEKIREESRKVAAAVVKKFLSSIDLGEFFAE